MVEYIEVIYNLDKNQEKAFYLLSIKYMMESGRIILNMVLVNTKIYPLIQNTRDILSMISLVAKVN
jgi:hypothetical protein